MQPAPFKSITRTSKTQLIKIYNNNNNNLFQTAQHLGYYYYYYLFRNGAASEFEMGLLWTPASLVPGVPKPKHASNPDSVQRRLFYKYYFKSRLCNKDA